MKYSNETQSFITSLINNYGHYDNLSESYEINIHDIDEDDIYKLCALLMKDCPDLAYEAASSDNPMYEEIMLPSLKDFMADSSLEEMVSFSNQWQKGILSYFTQRIIYLLDDALEIYNQDLAA